MVSREHDIAEGVVAFIFVTAVEMLFQDIDATDDVIARSVYAGIDRHTQGRAREIITPARALEPLV